MVGNAQIYTPNGTIQGLSTNNNNVGIGTNTPSDKLTVVGDAQIESNILLGHTGNTNRITSREVNQLLTIAGSDQTTFDTWSNGWLERMRITNNGNVGIGTNSPSDKLTVAGSAQIENNILLGHVGNTNRITSREVNQILTIAGSDQTTFDTWSNGWLERMRITNNGNVGIGTTNPTSKLTVAGNINSREVKVTVDAGADFVFDTNYNLPSLDSVDKYIKENKHLPQIASADEMKKDGINLSKMNIKLLQKIEEMTLYMIEMKKDNEQLKNSQKNLEDRLKKIETR